MSTVSSDVCRGPLLRAIQIEARNAEVYNSLAQLFVGYEDSVTAIFSELAAEERRHGMELEKLYRERFGAVPSPGEEPKEVIEAPDLEDPEALVFDSMTVEQALKAGLRAEQMARQFYSRESSRTSDAELRKVYRELGEFENAHVRLLNDRLAEKGRAGASNAR
ncbi:MAG: ferritin family protein [Acidobacteriia bacterium]|nr:ferritin family protein [Terriglobia bacterium]